jgi:hypothetical protein
LFLSSRPPALPTDRGMKTRSCLVLRNRKSGYAGDFSSHRVARSRAIIQICF